MAENVAKRPIEKAKEDVERIGYVGWAKRIGADEAGADHQRRRWWLCAYADDQGEFHRAIDAEVAKLPEICRGVWGRANYARAIRVPDGVPARVDRLRCLGNAVVPQIVEMLGRRIMAEENPSR